ncbi:unnamed protein product [Protopolystoma xenopodis]|uniref:Uncharacterized protein n=1 Tax=Protopolystoma xenopodis TaxID=117903 RepID=A0A3S5CUV9_9PLAT|nr:unnamed protein product [Protopolystoma xenopodis]
MYTPHVNRDPLSRPVTAVRLPPPPKNQKAQTPTEMPLSQASSFNHKQVDIKFDRIGGSKQPYPSLPPPLAGRQCCRHTQTTLRYRHTFFCTCYLTFGLI